MEFYWQRRGEDTDREAAGGGPSDQTVGANLLSTFISVVVRSRRETKANLEVFVRSSTRFGHFPARCTQHPLPNCRENVRRVVDVSPFDVRPFLTDPYGR